ncbi:MAG: CoA ester lyase [Pirellulaceae bacterium]
MDYFRPRHSVLYVPASHARAVEKAARLPADVLILDLEDAVAPAAKSEARERACAAVTGMQGREVVIRINADGTPWHHDDIAAVAAVPHAKVLIPKVRRADDVVAVTERLVQAGMAPHRRLWVMLETPTAILHASAIASATTALEGLVLGFNDLASELRVEAVPGRAPLLYALAAAVLAARCADKLIFDGVYTNLSDQGGFEEECRQARAFGCDGKTLIHPDQIDICHRVFCPTPADVERAQRIVTAFAAAKAAGQGVTRVDGQMIEQLHADQAHRMLAQAATRAKQFSDGMRSSPQSSRGSQRG